MRSSFIPASPRVSCCRTCPWRPFALPGKPHVGTGPFQLSPTSRLILLRAFDGYRGGRPAIDTVKISEYATQRQAWAAMMRGEADVLHDVSVESLDFVEAESTVQTFSFVKAYYQALVFNLTLPLFAQKDVRRALNTAIDRSQVVDISLRKRGIPSDGPIWPYHFGRSARSARLRLRSGSGGGTAGRAWTDPRPRAAAGPDAEPLQVHLPDRARGSASPTDWAGSSETVVQYRRRHGRGAPYPHGSSGHAWSEGNSKLHLSEFGSMRSLNFVYALWHSVPPGGQRVLSISTTAPRTLPWTSCGPQSRRKRSRPRSPSCSARSTTIRQPCSSTGCRPPEP